MSKKIGILGCSSNVGKTTVALGIMRCLYNRGYHIAPFKALNISLNSKASMENLEMSTSQYLQAQACNISPSVLMSPILLKPSTNSMQQIINGKIDHNQYRLDQRIDIAYESYQKLSKQYEMIVVEGSGSCAELNLLENDVANFSFMDKIDSDVILVANIKNCGIFGMVYGTISILKKEHQDRIKGIIINEFEGDITYFNEGKKILEDLVKIPVLGVIPSIKMNFDEEDMIELKENNLIDNKINVGVIKLPHLCNATDFQVLLDYDHLNVSYITDYHLIKDYDMVILPGTKNTIDDLVYLKDHNFKTHLKEAINNDVMIFGICGGLQMLGSSISDEYGLESKIKLVEGFNIFDYKTEIKTEKKTNNLSLDLNILDKNYLLKGYEIRCGITSNQTLNDINYLNKENVYVTYLHNIFHNEIFTYDLIQTLFNKKNLSYQVTRHNKTSFDDVANIFEKYCDINKIIEIMER